MMMPNRRREREGKPLARTRVHSRRDGGFSLIEVMVAMVILGLGLVMVATIFPVAWEQARQLSELTNETAVVDTAATTVAHLVAVHGWDGGDTGSFAGDLMVDGTSTPPFLYAAFDTRVHLLHLENLRASAPRAFTGLVADVAPYDLEGLLLNVPEADMPGEAFQVAQIDFASRVFPPMRERLDVNFGVVDHNWDQLLDSRRFAWAVFHRLPVIPVFNAVAAKSVRKFDMYYVTLRRPQPTYRYARQDVEWAPSANPFDPPAVNIAASAASEDVVLPEPWRVQILLPEKLRPDGHDPTATVLDPETLPTAGIPTEVSAGNTLTPGVNLATNELVARLFQRGSFFIDERSGLVYEVQKLRYNAQGDVAFMTLDREIRLDDVKPNGFFNPIDGLLDNAERLRTVWVFPPPSSATRRSNDNSPNFEGRQPVIGIEVRSLKVAP